MAKEIRYSLGVTKSGPCRFPKAVRHVFSYCPRFEDWISDDGVCAANLDSFYKDRQSAKLERDAIMKANA